MRSTAMAAVLRPSSVPTLPVVTYSRKVFIPLTELCRNRCGYCTFVKEPDRASAVFLSPEQALAIAEEGRRAGCKEALLSLGERPEALHAEARAFLARQGCASTVEYLRDVCRLVLERTGLVPHVNGGALHEDELALLRPFVASMGVMLESVAERLCEPGGPHHGCPDKAPARRLATIEAAGRLRIPFTTGILIGIGETVEERRASLEAIAGMHRRHGHIQEVIVQNFRLKEGIAMAAHPEPTLDEMLATISLAREILPAEVVIQAPPNLMPGVYRRYIAAGLDDWGGVSPVTRDHINPEAAWPAIVELAAETAAAGRALRERLTVHPRYVLDAGRWMEEPARSAVLRLAGEDGYAAEQRLS